ncbi:L,D-transpeptidase family protein [Paenibacillus puerhi]|uniref:L,D-transpeptidase family protein n=1 Tax=Paenibacillus puerhi TaxID=2692622 RepID=UPI00135A2578|nr:L,D-transpeptidase family protein [Paenibacillus puerhi]
MQPVRGRFPSPQAVQLVRLRKNLYVNRFDPLYHEKVIRYLDPHSPEAHFRLGQHYELKDMRNKAIQHYKQAMHAYPSEFYYPAAASIRRLSKQEEESLLNKERTFVPDNSSASKRALPLFLKVLLLTLLLANVLLLLLFFTPPDVSKVVTFLKPWPVVGKSVTYESLESPFMLPIPYGQSEQDVENLLHKKTLSLANTYPSATIVLYGVATPAKNTELNAVPLTENAWKDQAFVVAEYNPAIDRAVKIRFLQPELLKAHNQASASLVRTALLSYKQQYGYAPALVSDLLHAYPHNYLSFLPEEAGSGSDVVRTFFDGSGGWVYDREAKSAEAMFFPNTEYGLGGDNGEIHAAQSIPFEPLRLWVNLSEHTVELWSGKLTIARYKVGLGADNSTPAGRFQVNQRVWAPLGRTPGVYGTVALGLGDIALHGTSDEDSVGANRSLGCIRLNNTDMAALFQLVPLGTEVIIHHGDEKSIADASLEDTRGRAGGAYGDWLFPTEPPIMDESRERADNTLFHWLG